MKLVTLRNMNMVLSGVCGSILIGMLSVVYPPGAYFCYTALFLAIIGLGMYTVKDVAVLIAKGQPTLMFLSIGVGVTVAAVQIILFIIGVFFA